MPPQANTTPADRFWAKVEKTDSCWLWRGSLSPAGYGQVRLGYRPSRLWLAHRLAWTWEVGPIPEGMCVLHRCDNPLCIRVDHLFLGTKKDNSRDMAAKGRGTARFTEDEAREIRTLAQTVPLRELARRFGTAHVVIGDIVRGKTYAFIQADPIERPDFIRGRHHHNAKLTEEAVAEIRRAYAAGGVTQKELAERYGVGQQTISKIVHGTRWHHVTEKVST